MRLHFTVLADSDIQLYVLKPEWVWVLGIRGLCKLYHGCQHGSVKRKAQFCWSV